MVDVADPSTTGNTTSEEGLWWKIAESSSTVLPEGGRLHAQVDGRFVTAFRHRGELSCIDAICHHAGGPLTLGRLEDIEDLGLTVVLCPWHKFMVDIKQGFKTYQAVEMVNGKLTNTGWKVGKMTQRVHLIREDADESLFVKLQLDGHCGSDGDSYSARCARDYPMHTFSVVPSL
jgi:nitrite reductase/ring-hydroxylating ferredoxin subunit